MELSGLNDLIYATCLKEYTAHRKHSVHVMTIIHILLMRRLMVRVVEMMACVSGRVKILAAV